MGDLSTTVEEGSKRIGSGVSSYFTLANAISLARAAVHSVEMVFLNYPVSHRATFHSVLESLRKNLPILGNGIKQRDLIMPPKALNGYHAGDKSGIRGGLDADLEWFYRRSGNKYRRFGNLISADDTVCEIDYREGRAKFSHGTSHELEPLLKQRGFQVSYNQNSHR